MLWMMASAHSNTVALGKSQVYLGLLVLYFAPFVVQHRYPHLQNIYSRTDLLGAIFTAHITTFNPSDMSFPFS